MRSAWNWTPPHAAPAAIRSSGIPSCQPGDIDARSAATRSGSTMRIWGLKQRTFAGVSSGDRTQPTTGSPAAASIIRLSIAGRSRSRINSRFSSLHACTAAAGWKTSFWPCTVRHCRRRTSLAPSRGGSSSPGTALRSSVGSREADIRLIRRPQSSCQGTLDRNLSDFKSYTLVVRRIEPQHEIKDGHRLLESAEAPQTEPEPGSSGAPRPTRIGASGRAAPSRFR